MTTFIASTLFLGFGLVGCNLPAAPAVAESTNPEVQAKPAAQTKPTAVPTNFERIEDPVEQCFSVEAPKGWYNRAYSVRIYDIHRQVATAVSPNSDTVLFLGDPSIPQYWAPNSGNPYVEQFCQVNPMMEMGGYVPATSYMPNYVTKKFGKLAKFKITSVKPNKSVLQLLQSEMAQAGMPMPNADCVDVHFTYTDHGKTTNGLVIGTTMDGGFAWQVEVWGLSTTGDPETFRPTLMRMAKSNRTNPDWTARQQQKHQQIMAEMQARMDAMTRQHEQNMAWIQDSAQRHQQRMQAMWDANDASINSYYERSASSDLQHQQFLNYINDENTVVGSEGRVRQVDNSYQRYFINKTTNAYVGGDINFDDRAIRKMGLNPDDYEEAKIRP